MPRRKRPNGEIQPRSLQGEEREWGSTVGIYCRDINGQLNIENKSSGESSGPRENKCEAIYYQYAGQWSGESSGGSEPAKGMTGQGGPLSVALYLEDWKRNNSTGS